VKSGWRTTSLGELCGFVRGPFGGSLKKSIFVEDGFAVYEQQHAIYNQFEEIRYFIDNAKFREMQRFELRPKDLIMSCSGTMGRVAIVPENIRRGIINQALLKLTPSSAVSPEFLKYWMDSGDFQESLKEQCGGAAIQNVASVSILKQIQISLPALPEQQRIVRILDTAFEGIATAKVNAEKNLQNARALFESHLQAIFTERGEGWVEKPLVEVCVLQRGFDLPTRSRTSGDFPLVSSSGIIDTHNKGPVKGPGVATGRSGSIGNVFYIEEDYWPLNTVLYVKEFCGNNPKFIYRLLCHFDLKRFATGAGVPTLNRNFVHDERVVIPKSNNTQRAIAEQLDDLEVGTQRLESIYKQKLSALEALKKSLLHEGFTGGL
jgi:type I restriction enzyme S subunit